MCRVDLQEEIVQLEAECKEDEYSKRRSKTGTGPVIGGLRYVEAGDEDGCPDPPSALQNHKNPECASTPALQRN